MHEQIITFCLDNANYLCIPFGIFLSWYKTYLESRNKKRGEKKSEELLTKTYEQMLSLYERNDDALEERTHLLVKNAILKNENKSLKTHNTELALTVATLKQRVLDLELHKREVMKII